jgi:hypothetical protein
LKARFSKAPTFVHEDNHFLLLWVALIKKFMNGKWRLIILVLREDLTGLKYPLNFKDCLGLFLNQKSESNSNTGSRKIPSALF